MRRVRSLLACVALSALATGCASGPSSRTASQAEIDTHVAEASRRFDMPEVWIREVMRQESGGRTTLNGKPIVSKAGAMGLMQVMPATYEEMRRKHNLGSDPFDPHDNIIAGTAYLREMYNLFGAPGFLGAYNCGPGCYGDYLAGKRRLPDETVRYIAAVGPRLNRAPAPAPENSDIVLVSAPAEPSYSAPATTPAVSDRPRVVAQELPPVSESPGRSYSPVPVPAPTPIPAPAPRPAPVPSTSYGSGGYAGGPSVWMVQLGAFRSPDDGARVIDRARRTLPSVLGKTQQVVQAVDTKTGLLYRARLAGLSQEAANSTCASLVGQGMACFVVAPGA